MNNLYALYREVNPTTGVEFTATGSFIACDETNLIVCKASELEIYSLTQIDIDQVFYYHFIYLIDGRTYNIYDYEMFVPYQWNYYFYECY